MEERRDAYRVWWRNLSERGHLEYICIHKRIILKYILQKIFWTSWIGFIWLSIGTSGRLL